MSHFFLNMIDTMQGGFIGGLGCI